MTLIISLVVLIGILKLINALADSNMTTEEKIEREWEKVLKK